jgi:hypothetical protein
LPTVQTLAKAGAAKAASRARERRRGVMARCCCEVCVSIDAARLGRILHMGELALLNLASAAIWRDLL